MSRTWIISDTHFSHYNMAMKFLTETGERMRNFSSVEEMDETMIERWNEVVKEKDRVYHLGDVTFSRQAFASIMPRLNGRLVLIKGNHDMFDLRDYKKYFDDIRSVIVRPKHGIIFSHYPIHPSSLNERISINVHGHTHTHKVMLDEANEDYRYLNVSVEQMDYRPVQFEEIVSLAELRRGVYGES